MTAADFRRLALAIPGAAESAHQHHPDFRIEGRIFATLGYPGDGWGMVKLSAEQQQSLVSSSSGTFIPCKGIWGRQGSTNVHLAAVDEPALRSALNLAAHNIVLRVRKKRG